jgi:hypothetical protein
MGTPDTPENRVLVVLGEYGDHTITTHTGSPALDPALLTSAAQARINTANDYANLARGGADSSDSDRCDACGVSIGYYADNTNDEFNNDGFYVTPAGRALCDLCGIR